MIATYNCSDVTNDIYQACLDSDAHRWSVGGENVCSCSCRDDYCPDHQIQNPSTCECECPQACGANQVQLDNCECICDPEKVEQCNAQASIKFWDSDTCECKCKPISCVEERSQNPETCECDCDSPTDPTLSQCIGNQVLTDVGGHKCECQCNSTDEMIANCFLADPTQANDAQVNVDFAEHLESKGHAMRWNYFTCMCDLEKASNIGGGYCPPQVGSGEFFPSDILSCTGNSNFDFYFNDCECKCRPDIECFGNKILNESSCECECSSSRVNFCNSVSGTLLSDENCECVDYPGTSLKSNVLKGSTSVNVHDTTIFDGASEAILSPGTNSEETMTLSSSTSQLSDFDNVVQTDTSGHITFTTGLANDHPSGTEIAPVYGDPPPPTMTGDPHVCTFFGETYDM